MTAQQIVNPKDIETELMNIWEKLAKENKTRACLFNLIIFTKLNKRADYIRGIAGKVIEKFPCRILFITSDPDLSKDYLKTAVSVVAPESGDSHIACDNIDIGVAGKNYLKVPFLILPHILPDLPVYLLWSEDPCLENDLFEKIEPLTHRIIFDSEASDDLISFAKLIQKYHSQNRADVADLNWARTEGWRDLIAASFYSEDRIKKINDAKLIHIFYNSEQTDFFCHFKIQALYLQAWLASRLGWQFESIDEKDQDLFLHYKTNEKPVTIQLTPDKMKDLTPGAILDVTVQTNQEEEYHFIRDKDQHHQVTIQISSKEKCEIPYKFILGKEAMGQSLSKEITYKGTSTHYMKTLELLTKVEKIC